MPIPQYGVTPFPSTGTLCQYSTPVDVEEVSIIPGSGASSLPNLSDLLYVYIYIYIYMVNLVGKELIKEKEKERTLLKRKLFPLLW